MSFASFAINTCYFYFQNNKNLSRYSGFTHINLQENNNFNFTFENEYLIEKEISKNKENLALKASKQKKVTKYSESASCEKIDKRYLKLVLKKVVAEMLKNIVIEFQFICSS